MNNIILFDGGMGQELVHRNNSTNDPLWSARVLMDNYSLVEDLHKEYITSGSKVIVTNSYSITPQRLKRFNLEKDFEKLQKLSVKAAKNAVQANQNRHIKIAGCIPPLEGSYLKHTSLSELEIKNTVEEIGKLQKNDVDFFICETMSSIKEAVNSIEGLQKFNKNIIVSFCVMEGNGHKLISGESLREACQEVVKKNIHGLTISCSQIEDIYLSIPILKTFNLPFGAFPNKFKSVLPLKLGMSVDTLSKREDINISVFTNHVKKWIEMGMTIVGGCCEISPKYILNLYENLIDNNYKITNSFKEV